MDIKNNINKLIESKREGVYWDFKLLPHDNKASLLHDIICLSNVLHNGPRFIILGVSDPKEECKIVGLKPGQANRKSQTDLIDFVRSKDFAGGFRPDIELKTINIQEKELDIIIIYDTPNKPYFLQTDYKDKSKIIRANYIYSRTFDTNTPINKSADLHLVEKLWRNRFGLDLQPLEKMKQLLQKPSEWFLDIGNKDYCYHKYHPEFNISFSSPKLAIEPFSYYYPSEESHVGDAVFKFHNTILYETKYMYCDEMRVELVWPKIAHVTFEGYNWFYYYDMSSLDGHLLFLLTNGSLNFSDRNGSEGAPFLIFKNKSEFKNFQLYIENNKAKLNSIKPGSASEFAAQKKESDSKCKLLCSPIFLGKIKGLYDIWKIKTYTHNS